MVFVDVGKLIASTSLSNRFPLYCLLLGSKNAVKSSLTSFTVTIQLNSCATASEIFSSKARSKWPNDNKVMVRESIQAGYKFAMLYCLKTKVLSGFLILNAYFQLIKILARIF